MTNGPVETEERSFGCYPRMVSSLECPAVNTAFCVYDELNPPYPVVRWSKARYSVLGGNVVKELSVYQIDVCDPANKPGTDEYLVYLHFEPATKRGYSTEAEFHQAASWIAERLIRSDERVSPGIMSRSRFRANRVVLDVDSLKGGPYHLGADITLWIELSPGRSRLQNRILVQLQILSMRSEVRA